MKFKLAIPVFSTFAICSLLPSAAVAEAPTATANCSSSFHIVNRVSGSGIGVCEATATSNGASLSYTFDHIDDNSSGSVNAALAFRLGAIGTSKNSSFSTLLFSEFDGVFGSTAKPNKVRTGLYTEIFTKSESPFTQSDLFLLWGLSAFHLTDFDFGAEGYGVSASLTPVINSDQFGVNYRGESRGHPYLIARAELEALSIQVGGETGYDDDSQHANFGVTLGLGYRAASSAEFKFDTSFSYSTSYDLIGDADLETVEGRFSIPLGGSENVSLTLAHDQTDSANTSPSIETTKMTFDFRF